MKYLAIFKNEIAESILEGKITINIRLSKIKNTPYNQVSVNDIVLIKPTGKDIIGQFRVKKVITIEGLTKQDLEQLESAYPDSIITLMTNMDSAKEAKFATLIFIGELTKFLTSPFKLSKKSSKPWQTLE